MKDALQNQTTHAAAELVQHVVTVHIPTEQHTVLLLL